MWCMDLKSSSHLSKLYNSRDVNNGKSLSHQLFGGVFFGMHQKGLRREGRVVSIRIVMLMFTRWSERGDYSKVWQSGKSKGELGSVRSVHLVIGNQVVLLYWAKYTNYAIQGLSVPLVGTKLHYCTTVLYKVHLGNWGISCAIVQCKCSNIDPSVQSAPWYFGTIVLLYCTKCTLVIGDRAKTGATTPHCLHQLLVTRACTSDR